MISHVDPEFFPVGSLVNEYVFEGGSLREQVYVVVDDVGNTELYPNGQRMLRQNYPLLYEVIEKWQPEWCDEIEFTLPDLHAKVLITEELPGRVYPWDLTP